MLSLEIYVEHAPQCAQGILIQWGQMFHAKIQWTPEFDSVLNLACNYIDASKHREQSEHLGSLEGLNGKLDDEIAEAEAKESCKRHAFAVAYKTAEEKPRPKAKSV